MCNTYVAWLKLKFVLFFALDLTTAAPIGGLRDAYERLNRETWSETRARIYVLPLAESTKNSFILPPGLGPLVFSSGSLYNPAGTATDVSSLNGEEADYNWPEGQGNGAGLQIGSTHSIHWT
jgi:hypothetical protein